MPLYGLIFTLYIHDREDLDGYEYRENIQERRKRQRIMQEYETKLTVCNNSTMLMRKLCMKL